MKNAFVATATALLMLTPLSVQAAEQTVVLSVHHADCALCGPIIKKSLERVTGVKAVAVSPADAMANVTATVKFDDSLANIPALIAATTNAGYPSSLAQ